MLHRACAQCGRFLAAATRRCLGRVSVPVWLIVLTDQLPVAGLVGHYPTNNLMGRTPLRLRLAAFLMLGMSVRGISSPFGGVFRTSGQVRTCSSAVRHSAPEGAACDLHALGTPPALILSQDQTRQKMVKLQSNIDHRPRRPRCGDRERRLMHTSVGKVPATQKRAGWVTADSARCHQGCPRFRARQCHFRRT